MYTDQHEKKRLVNETYPRIDIKDYVKAFLLDIRKKEGRSLNANHLGGAMHMKELLNKSEYTEFKSMRSIDGLYGWDEQKVEYVASNLGQGRGYLFYFICNRCHRKVKYLYEWSMLDTPLCRICCRLSYQVPSRKARDISRLIRKPYLSSEDKYFLIKRAGITKKDIPDELQNGV